MLHCKNCVILDSCCLNISCILLLWMYWFDIKVNPREGGSDWWNANLYRNHNLYHTHNSSSQPHWETSNIYSALPLVFLITKMMIVMIRVILHNFTSDMQIYVFHISICILERKKLITKQGEITGHSVSLKTSAGAYQTKWQILWHFSKLLWMGPNWQGTWKNNWQGFLAVQKIWPVFWPRQWLQGN